jgi:hypothetical protein
MSSGRIARVARRRILFSITMMRQIALNVIVETVTSTE